MRKVVSHPCGECQFGNNSPFSSEIQKKLKADMLSRGDVYTCHWTEKTNVPVTHLTDTCEAHRGRISPFCATGAAMLLKLAETDKSELIQQEAKKIRQAELVDVNGPEEIRKALKPHNLDPANPVHFTMSIDSPYGPGRRFVFGLTPEQDQVLDAPRF